MHGAIIVNSPRRVVASFSRHNRKSFFRTRPFIVGTLSLVTLLLFYSLSVSPTSQHVSLLQNTSNTFFGATNLASSSDAAGKAPYARVAKATMLYGRRNSILEEALGSHAAHNKLYGYQMHVLRSRLTEGFANELLWLQKVIMSELQKPALERVEWIMSFDPSSLVLNPRIPLELFLPPRFSPALSTLTFILTHPAQETNCPPPLFIRVAPTSITILAKAIVAGSTTDRTRTRGADTATSALQAILSQDEHRDLAIHHPPSWYTSALSPRNSTATSGFLACAPSDAHPARWKEMQQHLDFLSHRPAQERQRAVYASETQTFWRKAAAGKKVLQRAEVQAWRTPVERFAYEADALAEAVEAGWRLG